MGKKDSFLTKHIREKAIIVAVSMRGQQQFMGLEDSLDELTLLCDTAGLEVVGEVTQKVARPNTVTMIGSGKVDELRAIAEENLADVVVFDDELSPRHQRELEEKLGGQIRVLDRTAVILDIFAQHAHTSDGQLQVKLAQYEYYLPRLTGKWTHLARQSGGGGGRTGSIGGVGLRGPGETQLEVDRRAIRREIVHLKDDIEKLRAQRAHYRAHRKKSQLPTIAIVGYTNAGKSTLLNTLAHTNILVADQLFATLDPTTRQIRLRGGKQALITDTVGFIQKLPTTLIAAFQATLEEIASADLLLHMIDISHQNALNQSDAVLSTLKDINADQIPIITAFNKIDRLVDPTKAQAITGKFSHSVAISALRGDGMNDLLELIYKILFSDLERINVRIPYQEGYLISLFHDHGQVEQVTNGRKAVIIKGQIPVRYKAQFAPWQVAPDFSDKESEDSVDAE